MTIAEWQDVVHAAMHEKGHHSDLADIPLRYALGWRLALIHTEVTEAVQECKRHVHRDQRELTLKQKVAIGGELADIVIRVMDLCGCLGVGLQSAIEFKMQENMRRPHRYGTPDEVKPDA